MIDDREEVSRRDEWSSPAPDSMSRPGMAIPKTLYVWLVLLILAFIAPRYVADNQRHVAAGKESTLSATEFSDLARAETNARSAFAIEALRSVAARFGGAAALSVTGTRSNPDKLFQDSEKTYRSLLKALDAPNLARRILIIEHARHKPLDTTILNKDLPAALRAAHVQARDIDAELRLWPAIYGEHPAVSHADLTADEQLIRGMNLRYLSDRLLADLYTAGGEQDRAASFDSAFNGAALSGAVKLAALSFVIFVAAVIGCAMAILFLAAAKNGNWAAVARRKVLPQALGWGDLLDAFVFYLAIVKSLGLGIGVLASSLLPDSTPAAALALDTSVYIGTACLALLYLLWRVRARGATLADIGLRAPGNVWADIGYGVAGYCAAMPLVFVLGAISQKIFAHDPTRTPNPILPLIAVEHDPFGRILIYLLVAVAAPFFEELFFRGALFSGLRTRTGWVASAALSAAVFAVAHPMQDWLPIFGLGFVLATMREMRQSLIPGMTAHFLQNTFAFLAMSVLFGS